MSDIIPAPWRIAFDNARDPYTARNALGITTLGGGGSGAPDDAQYITAATDATLTAERVLTNTATITWDFTTPGQAKASTAAGGGNVSNSGTPTSGQYAKWVTSTTIQGVAPATVLSDIGAQPAGSYQPLDADLTAIAALTGTDTIYYRSGSAAWSAVTVSTGLSFVGGVLTATGGGGTPGGSNTQVQYNNSSAFGGSANFVWNNTTSVLTVTGQLSVAIGNATSIVAGGVVEALSFRCAGVLANFAPASSGQIVLRPSGPSNTTGQVQITTTSVIMNNPVTLPADPTTALQAATKQYVDTKAPLAAEYITSTANATLTNERVLTDTATVTWDRTTAGQIKANAAGGGTSTTISDTPPGSPTAGSLWWESDTGTLWIYYTDANTSQWVMAAGGSNVVQPGALVQIQRQDVSSAVAQVDFTSGIDSTYDEYELRCIGMQVSTAGNTPTIRISQDAGATWKAGASDYGWSSRFQAVSGNADLGTATASSIFLSNGLSGNVNFKSDVIIKFMRPWATDVRKVFFTDLVGHNATNGVFRQNGSGYYTTDNNAVNGVRIVMSGGNFTAGSFVLYGVKK